MAVLAGTWTLPVAAGPEDGRVPAEGQGAGADGAAYDGYVMNDGTIGVIEAPGDTRQPYDATTADPIQADGLAVENASPDALPQGSLTLAPERGSRAGARSAANKAQLVRVPVVVELFTAQGCSTCPPADGLIEVLADQPDVLTLSWHVDYWDYLGWPDNFADPANTTRQEGYAAAAGERGVYTPQIVVDGQDTLIGVSRSGLLALIDEHASRPPAVMVTASESKGGYVIDLTPRAAIPGGVQVSLIRYVPQRQVSIKAGENRGQNIVYRNVVVGMEKLSDWPARTPLRLTVRPGTAASGGYPADTRHAIIVQQPLRQGRPGPILAAVRLD